MKKVLLIYSLFIVIGKHSFGNAPVTIDEIYKMGKDFLVVDTAVSEAYFSTFDNGILSFCGYYRLGCADDCYTGLNIYGIKWLK